MGSVPGIADWTKTRRGEARARRGCEFAASPVATASKPRSTWWRIWRRALVRDWLGARLGRMRRDHVAFEELIHQFRGVIDQADDPAAVEAELLRLVRRMAPSSRIELVAEAGNGSFDDAADEPRRSCFSRRGGRVTSKSCSRFRCAAARRSAAGCAFARGRAATSSYSTEDIRRLTTLGTIAACAMEGLGLFTEWPEKNASH